MSKVGIKKTRRLTLELFILVLSKRGERSEAWGVHRNRCTVRDRWKCRVPGVC